MKKTLFALLALLSVTAAQAATPVVTVTWTRSTTYTDSTPIVNPVTYQLYVGATGAEVAYKTPVASPPYVLVPTPAPGTQVCVQVTATVDAVESARSPEVCTVIPKATPAAPGAVKITVS